MTVYPCDSCKNKRCSNYNCVRWKTYFLEHWAYIHGYAIAHNVQPTTPPMEEVNPIEDEGTEEADS